MVGNRRKKNGNITGGYRQFRAPLVYNASKKQKEKRNNFDFVSKLNLKYIIYAAILFFAMYLFLFSTKFTVKDIIVEGNTLVSTEKLVNYIPKDSNIFRLNIDDLKKNILAENTEIKEIRIYKGLPNAIKIVILEHENKILWQSNERKYFVSSQGVVSKELDSELASPEMPLVKDSKNIAVTVGDTLVSPNFVSFILNIDEKFFELTNINPTYYEVMETTFDVNVYTEAGFYVKFNSMRSSTKQLNNLKEVLVQKRNDIKEYIDLRIDGWAYYK